MYKFIRCFLLFLLWIPFSGSSQVAALKTNVLGWATSSLTLGTEVGLAPRWSLNAHVYYNPFDKPFGIDNGMKWKHVRVQPEVRYWLCERFYGHFFGLHLLYSHFNANRIRLPFGIFPATRDHRFQGNQYGAGISYGYQWILSSRWSIEATLGVGYKYTTYDKYECRECGTKVGSGNKGYFGPTEAAISFIYMLR